MPLINVFVATIVLWAGLTIMGIPIKPRLLIAASGAYILYFSQVLQ